MRVMALDVGDKNIGIAVSDALLMIAQGRSTLRRTGWEADLAYLREVIEENEVDKIVVGNPLHMDGRESPQGKKIAQFARKLSETLGIPIVFWYVRLTSLAVERALEEVGLKRSVREDY